MSRLSKILNVEDGQEFEYERNKLKVVNNKIFAVDIINGEESWFVLSNAEFLMSIIASPEKIKIIQQKLQLTEQQITVIKGRVAEGWNWIARNKFDTIYYYKKIEPTEERGYFLNGDECQFVINPNLFDFVTYENSPIYLPDLIGDDNNE